MSGPLLIVSPHSARRTALRNALEHAGHRVQTASDAADAAAHTRIAAPRLALVPVRDAAAVELVARIRRLGCPVIAVEAPAHLRLPLLEAGATDVLSGHARGALLLARLRAELRRGADLLRLRPHNDTGRALGFAEDGAAEGLHPPGTIAVLTGDESSGAELGLAIRRLTRARVSSWLVGPRRARRCGIATPDVLVIDATTIALRPDGAPVLRIVPELRSDPDTAPAMQLVRFAPDQEEFAAMALDMGADDVIAAEASPAEIAHRAGLLMRRKSASDRFRDSVRLGLEAAVTDPLTGLHNRRYAVARLQKLASIGGELSVMVLDLDHFKAVNDRFGHAAGDDLLIGMADRLRDALRAPDLLARTGGEEFVIALYGAGIEVARIVARRICTTLADKPFHFASAPDPVQITASIGLTTHRGPLDADGAEAVIARADAALYAAKSAGRNRVCVMSEGV